jgi:DtxR family Mn-dependent transcriptional regulator
MLDPLLTLSGALLIIAMLYLLFRPERGVIPRWRRTRQLGERARGEDALKHIYSCEMQGERPTVQNLAGALHITGDEAAGELGSLAERGLVLLQGGEIRLTAKGRSAALHILRAHRLWEQYLANETGYPEVDWHDQAEVAEHRLTAEELQALSAQLGHPRYDPHGDPIPTHDGDLRDWEGVPLPAVQADLPMRIVHLEDEPEVVYAQIAAEGLHPGMEVRLIQSDGERVRFWAGNDEHLLAPIVAANIFVLPLPEERIERIAGEPLSSLAPGESARVVGISRACRGLERRRLMDLGILPGTVISTELQSLAGDPRAYRVRGALIALRQEQAANIYIERSGEVV